MLQDLVAQAGQFIELHQMWAGPVLGLVAFGESLALVGLLVPATPLMVVAGGLIGSGAASPWPILLCAVLGAVLGDAVSYWIGRSVGRDVYRRWPLNRDRTAVARARLFFRRFGFASIFFGRFLGPVRSTVPLVAGIMRMGHRKFQLANTLSAILWVPAILAPGFLAAQGFVRFGELSEAHMLGLAALLVAGTGGATWIAVAIVRRTMGGSRRRRPSGPSPASARGG